MLGVALVGCGADADREAWGDETDAPPGFVLLEPSARDEGAMLHIAGFCVPRTAEVAEPVDGRFEADLLVLGDELRTVASVPLEVEPDRILVVRSIDDQEPVRIDPDRALVRATHGRAVAELAVRVYADETAQRLEGSAERAFARTYVLRGAAVWSNLAAAELPEGVESIHPVPVGSDDDERDEVGVDLDVDLDGEGAGAALDGAGAGEGGAVDIEVDGAG